MASNSSDSRRHQKTMDLVDEDPHIQSPDVDHQIGPTTKLMKNYGGMSDDANNVDIVNKDNNGTTDDAFSFSRTPRQQKILLFAMGFVNFCACTCFSLLAPFYPTEAALKGVSETVTGFVFAVFELVIFITAPVFGNYITNIGSKFMFISGVMVCGVCAILFGLLDKCPDGNIFIVMCFLSRTVEALGASAYITASFAILSNEFPNHVATVIGLLETFSGIGLMVGPTIGSLLYEAGGYGLPFFTMGSILVVCAIISAYSMPKINDSGTPKRKSMLNLLRSPLCVITAVCIICGAYALGFFDPTYAKRLKELHLTVIQIGLMFLIGPGLYAFTAPLWGWIGDTKKLPKTLIIIGNFAMAFSFSMLGPSPLTPFFPFALWTQILGCVCLGIFLGCGLIPTFRTLLDGALQIGFEDNFVTFGMVSGLFNSCFSLGAFLGPTGGGLSVDHIHFPWAVTICCGLFFIAGSAMVIYCIVEKFSDCIPPVPAATTKNGYDRLQMEEIIRDSPEVSDEDENVTVFDRDDVV
ncbi:MFS-type transporter SLC18B1-like [Ylistrum balloti]|uniref:MFS-type transporter SLC18B1-like n=1 Tax=Ylistrum balloti TaxID=509963 RepID=UPI002905DDD5|nr:MFS-type transporter SLC18B1-like [Ylistrum balloti]